MLNAKRCILSGPRTAKARNFRTLPSCQGGPERRGLQCLFNLLSSRPPQSGSRSSKGPFMFACSRRAALWLPLLAVSAAWAAEDSDNTVVLTTKHGKVTIKLHPDWAPKHVAQIKTLVKQKFYDGLTFHRVIPGFMAQTGDPTGTGVRRLQPAQRAGRVQPDPFHARHPRHGARGGSEFRQFAVFHHDRRRGIPRRQIYGLRRGHLGHGRRRQDQGRNPGQQRRGRRIPTRSSPCAWRLARNK